MPSVTGRNPNTDVRLTKAMKQDTARGLIPRGEPGGANRAHWPVRSFAYYALGLAADPITEAPEQVEVFAGLYFAGGWRRKDASTPVMKALAEWSSALSRTDDEDRVFPGNTLHKALVEFIDCLSQPEGAKLRSLLRQGGGRMYLELVTEEGLYPSARIGIFDREAWSHEETGAFVSTYSFSRPDYTAARDLFLTALEKGSDFVPSQPQPVALRGSIMKTVRVPYAVFDALADLWADSRAHMEAARAVSDQFASYPAAAK